MAPHPRVPLIERFDVDEGHFPVGSSHDTIVLTADDKVNVISKLPPAVTTRTADSLTTGYSALDGAPGAQDRVWAPMWPYPVRANIPVSNRGDLVLIHVILHKRVWVGEIVSFSPLQKQQSFQETGLISSQQTQHCFQQPWPGP